MRMQRVPWTLILLLHLLHCDLSLSLNLEGLALLEFRSKVDVDPHGAFDNWNPRDKDPCHWSGVHCIDGKVDTLNLKGLSLGGTLAPELGKLSHLRSLVLYMNNFSGVIPKEIGKLTMLELLDLRGNNLSGTVPAELGKIISLRHLIQRSGLQLAKKPGSFLIPIRGEVLRFTQMLPWFKFKKNFPLHSCDEKHGINMSIMSEKYLEVNMQHSATSARRKLLEASSNLPAAALRDSPPLESVSVPSVGSGSFPAVPDSISLPDTDPASLNPSNPSQNHFTSSDKLGKVVIFAVLGAAILIAIVAGTLACCRQHAPIVGPCKTGLSGPLKKAFIDGVSKLNREELEAACEDFSNIINTFPNCTVFKGTLSSGVEIAVVSTVLTAKHWSKRSQAHFREKVDTLSRINHKNFINILGYCEDNEPFTRMIVYEYAPNGTLNDHLHMDDYEHLDWRTRMRIIMGVAYCLQYTHHELNPPVLLSSLQSNAVFITDDYAAKVSDVYIWEELVARRKKSMDEDMDPSNSLGPDPNSNVYNFGMLLLETISGKLPYSDEEGSIVNWAADYIKDKNKFRNLVDPNLKSFEDNELEIICEVIHDCIYRETKDRPTMREITTRLKDVIGISPEAAWPRLSPLWWAELEILSVEAS